MNPSIMDVVRGMNDDLLKQVLRDILNLSNGKYVPPGYTQQLQEQYRLYVGSTGGFENLIFKETAYRWLAMKNSKT